MKYKRWLYPGIGVKRWVLLMVVSFIMISAGISIFLDYQLVSRLEELIVALFSPVVEEGLYFFNIIIALMLMTGGLLGINFALRGVVRGLYRMGEDNKYINKMYKENVLEKGPRVVALGGGTGLSNLLRGLKHYTSNITAIVTVADDGGSSGKLRKELGMLPPGDIRNCLVALADAEPLMQELFQYRFSSEGHLVGHSFGNLFIASLTEVLGDFEEAVRESSKVLAIRGQVLPATNENVHLGAVYNDKTVKLGESVIPDDDRKIERVFLQPSDCKPTADALEAIQEADIIVIGPGSLYTSIIPNLMVTGIPGAIKNSEACKMYICNVMTQPGETTDYTVGDHIRAINKHGGEDLFDYVVANKGRGTKSLTRKYEKEGAYSVRIDKKEIEDQGVALVEGNLLSMETYLRHDPDQLAEIIFRIAGSR
ncbi:MAG: gluconeogenesis factor YvcK family protein [Halanaerobiales bacterium]